MQVNYVENEKGRDLDKSLYRVFHKTLPPNRSVYKSQTKKAYLGMLLIFGKFVYHFLLSN